MDTLILFFSIICLGVGALQVIPVSIAAENEANDQIVAAILNKISALMRKHYNIERPAEPVNQGGNVPPPQLIRYTIPQILSILKNMQKEFNMTEDTEFDYLLSTPPQKSRWRPRIRPRTRIGRHQRIAKRHFLRTGGAFSLAKQLKVGECLSSPSGRDYKGKVSMTVHGYPCQRWDSQTPHGHPFTNATAFPDESLSAAANYCRNPNPNFTKGVWCYTNAETFIRWDLCDVPLCTARSVITHTRIQSIPLYRTYFTGNRPKEI